MQSTRTLKDRVFLVIKGLAMGAANNAHSVASEAAYAASQAQADATAALNCCNDNAARMDRMFEKAMMK